MTNNVILSKNQERDIPTETPRDKAKPVSIDQTTKQKALQEQQREQALEQGKLLTPQQRLDALNKLTQNQAGDAFYKLPQGDLLVSQDRNQYNVTSFSVTLFQRDTSVTETAHTCYYNSEGGFKERGRMIHTDLKIHKNHVTAFRTTPKEISDDLWSEKFGDKLIKEALKLSDKSSPND